MYTYVRERDSVKRCLKVNVTDSKVKRKGLSLNETYKSKRKYRKETTECWTKAYKQNIELEIAIFRRILNPSDWHSKYGTKSQKQNIRNTKYDNRTIMIEDQQDHEWYVNIELGNFEENTSIMLRKQVCLIIERRQSLIPLSTRHEKNPWKKEGCLRL